MMHGLKSMKHCFALCVCHGFVQITLLLGRFALLVVCGSLMVLHEKYAKEPWRHIGLKVPHHSPPPPPPPRRANTTSSLTSTLAVTPSRPTSHRCTALTPTKLAFSLRPKGPAEQSAGVNTMFYRNPFGTRSSTPLYKMRQPRYHLSAPSIFCKMMLENCLMKEFHS